MIDLWPACQRMVDVLAGITDDQQAGATPCAEYTVVGLLGHVDTLSIRLAALARGEERQAGRLAPGADQPARARAGRSVAGAQRLAGHHRPGGDADQ